MTNRKILIAMRRVGSNGLLNDAVLDIQIEGRQEDRPRGSTDSLNEIVPVGLVLQLPD